MYDQKKIDEQRDNRIRQIHDAAVRTIHDENNKAVVQALHIAWQSGWFACMDAYGLTPEKTEE